VNVRTPLTSSPLLVEAHKELGKNFLRDLKAWLAPPEPSTNYKLGIHAYHKGTTTWFIEGNIFQEWDSTGSILWVHGKRTYFRRNLYLSLMIAPAVRSGFREEHSLVRHFFILSLHCSLRSQLCDHPAYPFTVRWREGLSGIFLL
jgi:hypothetical protein